MHLLGMGSKDTGSESVRINHAKIDPLGEQTVS